MESAVFRMRIRKSNGEGVSKKGPLVAKHPPSPSANQISPATSVGQSREVRSPMGPGPPTHRRRNGSPDPRNPGTRRVVRDTSPKTSPTSSPKSSPVRIPPQHRERSRSPGNTTPTSCPTKRFPNGIRSNGLPRTNHTRSTTTPSNGVKRVTPPTSPRVRRPMSPSTSSVRRNPSPVPPLKPELNSSAALKSRMSSQTTRKGSSPATTPHVGSPTTPTPVTSISMKGPPSPTIAAKRPISPTVSTKRVPSPINTAPPKRTPSPTTTSKRPPSPSSSRPASPGRRPASPRGTSPRGRGLSPGSRPTPITEEQLKARVARAMKARLYFLHKPGPYSFTIAGDSPSHKYKVIIGSQTCSCGHGPYCVHVLFVMVKVLQVADNHPTLMAGTLKEFEVEQMLRAWEDRREKALHARERRKDSSGNPLPSAANGGSKNNLCYLDSNSEEEAQCPICLTVMVEGESLVQCENGCSNFLHHHCMAVWAADRKAQLQPLLCPLCRASWPAKTSPRLTTTCHNLPPQYRNTSSNVFDDSSFAMMSASFSGLTTNTNIHPTDNMMSRSLTTTQSYNNNNDSAYSSPGGHSFGQQGLFGPNHPTVRGEISAAMVAGVAEEPVQLPRSEPIPEEHEGTAASWVHVFGRELVACLFSRDWVVRETGLRRLAHEVIKVLHWDSLVTGEQKRHQVIHCCANILAQVANDPVYKVYLACLRCLRALMSHLCPETPGEVEELQELLRPLLHTLLLKCADGNRRTSQISIDSIMELCRGQEGELALATHAGGIRLTRGLGDISYVLTCILNDSPPAEAPWQWLLGRLCVLDRLLDEFPHEFQLQMVSLQPADSGYKLQHYDRLLTVVEFAFKALGSSHATVSKLARRVYICGARMASSEPAVFHQVCDMLAKLDVSLQMRLKRRLRSLQGHQHNERRASLARLSDKLPPSSWDSNSGGPRLVRSVSHSPSRMLAALRSTSRSPARQPIMGNKAPSKFDSNIVKNAPKPTASPPRPTHLPLDSFETKFKEKQAKLKLYHKTRPKPDVPLVAQHVLVSPTRQEMSWNPLKPPSPLKSKGLSQSYGDTLDLSPQTPLNSNSKTPQYSFKDAVSTPVTPSAPFCTPVKEINNLSALTTSNVQEHKLFDTYETPLPTIPGLPLVPPYLDENVLSYDHESEIEPLYEEGVDWIKGPLLGTGAFSSCYQARDVKTGTIMAAKQVSFIRISEEDQEKVEATIEEEILLMSRLKHPNVVRLLGATRLSTSFSVFTEWMAGGSVSAMLEKYGAFTEPVILKYLKQVLAGISYLHSNTILHRDLKGANLLVDSTGQVLRIGDFGTATQLVSKSTVTGEFQGQFFGTIAFMAPEVLRGDDYGRACDVWSIGCCIIEMATTKPPWEEDYISNQYKLLFKIASSKGPPRVPETLSATTRELALRCLDIDSEKRPTAKELLNHSCFGVKPP